MAAACGTVSLGDALNNRRRLHGSSKHETPGAVPDEDSTGRHSAEADPRGALASGGHRAGHRATDPSALLTRATPVPTSAPGQAPGRRRRRGGSPRAPLATQRLVGHRGGSRSADCRVGDTLACQRSLVLPIVAHRPVFAATHDAGCRSVSGWRFHRHGPGRVGAARVGLGTRSGVDRARLVAWASASAPARGATHPRAVRLEIPLTACSEPVYCSRCFLRPRDDRRDSGRKRSAGRVSIILPHAPAPPMVRSAGQEIQNRRPNAT